MRRDVHFIHNIHYLISKIERDARRSSDKLVDDIPTFLLAVEEVVVL